MIARRSVLCGAMALPLAMTPFAIGRAEAGPFAGTYAPSASRIGDAIWMVRGADEGLDPANGGAIANSVIMASDAGAILIDSGPSLGFGKALAALARQLTGTDVARIYITHLHPDHSFGNAAFPAADIQALPATRAGLERDGGGFSDAMYRMLHGWMAGTEVVLPGSVAAEGRAVFGGRPIEVLALSGHSEGDLAILDTASGTLIAGDLVFHNRAPATPHADLAVWRTALSQLSGTTHSQVVPGHGPLCQTGAAIAQTGDWLAWLDATLRDAVASGLDMTEAASLPIPQRFAGVAAARYELTRSVSHFYPRLEAEIFPRIDG